MRSDSLGLFWRDEPPPPKQKKDAVKCIPPEPVWLKGSYLPHLEEALRFDVSVMSDSDLLNAYNRKEIFVFDIECYLNYFIISFRSIQTDKVLFFELYPNKTLELNKFQWVLQNFQIVGFNSNNYDLPITFLALAGKSNAILKRATEMIIVEGMRGSDILKQFKVKEIKGINHIDLIEVAPLRASLKIYGGRLHVPRMQDLPFDPDTLLSDEQIAIVRWYNINSDLPATKYLYTALEGEILLRTSMSEEIGIDLRSKSDAQIAEIVISDGIKKRTGVKPKRIEIPIGTQYKYKVPNFIQYKSSLLNWALNVIRSSDFVVDGSGSIGMPEAIKSLELKINNSVYKMGIGGLHSSETTISYVSDSDHILIDKDVTSYYPYIILLLRLFPSHLGHVFLSVYKDIVDRRIAAKRGAGELKALIKKGNLDEKIKVTYNEKLGSLEIISDSLKITINGSFGKLGNKYSILYSPDLMIQVTLTGQLSLLMLIERLELAEIPVVSANTDGIIIKCPRQAVDLLNGIVKQWELDTGFETEETVYRALYSRDVNNYIAVKEDGSTKCKGAYSNPWASGKLNSRCLHKNPVNTVCIEAVEKFLVNKIPIEQTIRSERDIRKFISVRTVKGGAVKDGQFLGKAIRWYYSKESEGNMVYALSGKKVPRSEGAKPLLDLPDSLPNGIDYDWYILECEKILKEIGFNYCNL